MKGATVIRPLAPKVPVTYTGVPSVMVEAVLFRTFHCCSWPTWRIDEPWRMSSVSSSAFHDKVPTAVGTEVGVVSSVMAFTFPRSPLSLSVIAPFCTSLPVSASNRTRALSVDDSGHTTPFVVPDWISVPSGLSATIQKTPGLEVDSTTSRRLFPSLSMMAIRFHSMFSGD